MDSRQRQELIQYILTENRSNNTVAASLYASSASTLQDSSEARLTEIHMGDLYFCWESRIVRVCDKEIDLTAKEFDILSLLIMNPNRVFTYEMIMDKVWQEALDFYSRKAINNHVSNLRRKLKVKPRIPDYIKSVHGVGYKFNQSIAS